MALINKGGRPVGSIETPKSLLERELRNTIKTVTGCRERLETQFAVIQKAISERQNIPFNEQLEILERLSNIMLALTKNIEILGKYSIGAAAGRKPTTIDDDSETKSTDLLKILGAKHG